MLETVGVMAVICYLALRTLNESGARRVRQVYGAVGTESGGLNRQTADGKKVEVRWTVASGAAVWCGAVVSVCECLT